MSKQYEHYDTDRIRAISISEVARRLGDHVRKVGVSHAGCASVYLYTYLLSHCSCLRACVLTQIWGPWLSFLSHIEIVKLHNLIVCLKFALGCRPV